MSTRGVVLLSRNKHRHPYNVHEIWYQHTDTYPEGLGVELLEHLMNYMHWGKVDSYFGAKPDSFEAGIEEIIAKCTQEKYPQCVDKPEDAYHRVQGDLEWIYCIELDPDNPSTSEFAVYKVVKMWGSKVADDFVYCCYNKWFAELPRTSGEVASAMEQVSEQGTVLQSAFRAFGVALERKEKMLLEKELDEDAEEVYKEQVHGYNMNLGV
jgi:hypothetical protein